MDSKQIWYGYYLHLDQVYRFLSKQSNAAFQRPKIHELYTTWVLARFLQYQKKSEHIIGFPSLEKQDDLTLIDLLSENIVLDNENFDTVIADVNDLKTPPIRLQVKRYTRVQNASADDFFEFMCSKVRRYGDAPDLSVVFHILEDMKFELPRFAELLKGENFEVGSILVFAGTTLKQRCFLFEVFPNYTGLLWSPVARNDQNENL